MKKTLLIALTSAVALSLAACGSSDNGTPAPAPTNDFPAAALQNSAGLLTFANQQVASGSETAEPFVVGDATLPLDDTTETSL